MKKLATEAIDTVAGGMELGARPSLVFAMDMLLGLQLF